MQNTIQATGPRGELPGVGKIALRIFCYEYVGKGAFGSGGWSRNAKHRPQPVVAVGIWEQPLSAGNPEVKGKRRRKFTAFDMSTTPPTILRRDYALDDLRKLGADVPKLYFDELGNMRGQSDELVMQGPNAWGPSTFVK